MKFIFYKKNVAFFTQHPLQLVRQVPPKLTLERLGRADCIAMFVLLVASARKDKKYIQN